MQTAPHILILAAGRGSRMRSDRPKVLHEALFRPMLHHVLELARSLPHRSITVVTGHEAERVEASCARYDVRFSRQERPLGTADAVAAARPFLASQDGDLLVLSGDVILLRRETMVGLLRAHAEGGAACTLLSAVVCDPHGYGRVIRRHGALAEIREEADCGPEERAVTEINGGVYCFGLKPLLEVLPHVGARNGQGERYLPDVVSLLAASGRRSEAVRVGDAQELLGVNDCAALADAEAVLKRRVNRELMLRGVRIHDPETVAIDPCCVIGQDVEIEAGVTLKDCSVGDGARLKRGTYAEGARIGAGSQVGPYAHLRSGTVLGRDVRVGNFVEIKNSTLGDETKATHLTYIGDARIGRRVNIGCGFITCNYSGSGPKGLTVVGDDVFIGSDTQAVAPVTIGDGSYVASGSTVTEDVPPDSLVISRGRQTTKPGYARKYRRVKEGRPA